MQRRSLLIALIASAALAPLAGSPALGRQRQDPGFPNIGYATWSEDEPAYRLFPGDEVDFQVGSAPELNKILTVQPDGRVYFPLVGPVMAADRSVADLQAGLIEAYGAQLVRPDVTVALRTAAPLKVFVGGEVDKPGVYDMLGDMDSLRAIFLAGGFRDTARRGEVVIIRRGPGGRAMMRTVDLGKGLRDPDHIDLVPLRRFDIVYVPKSTVAEADLFVKQYFRDLTPVDVGFSYALGAAAVR